MSLIGRGVIARTHVCSESQPCLGVQNPEVIPDNNNTDPITVPNTNEFDGSFPKTQSTALDLTLTNVEGQKFGI